jgi:hypothetical protein
MRQTKIALSAKELELVTNADWILTKNGIIQKVYDLFGGLTEGYRAMLEKSQIPSADIGTRSPKISKGEQYEELPWVMLDYPRNFADEDAFSIRSFFWWGNFCSITLQLSGKYQRTYATAVQQYMEKHGKDWFIGIGSDPWKHHFRKDNYVPVQEWEGDMITLPFVKIGKKISLHDWDQLDGFFGDNYQELIRIMTGNKSNEH